jgi:hypothetical protein
MKILNMWLTSWTIDFNRNITEEVILVIEAVSKAAIF